MRDEIALIMSCLMTCALSASVDKLMFIDCVIGIIISDTNEPYEFMYLKNGFIMKFDEIYNFLL